MPGYTKTDINAKLLDNPEIRHFTTESSVFKRLGQIEDFTDAGAFLASSDSRWLTGQMLDNYESCRGRNLIYIILIIEFKG
ncbi:SDR family oxidoreductase [Priestia endophytica]|nr:SDR family oxidoreductase [Priestia endophytica]